MCQGGSDEVWDEVFVQINGAQHSLWRAVDQEGNIRDILVQTRRDKRAATKFLRKLLKGLTSVPRVVITDKLASDGAAMRAVLPSVEHRRHKGLNNRAEHSHQPTRGCERRLRRFTSPGHARRFLAAYGPIMDRSRLPPDPRPTLRHLAHRRRLARCRLSQDQASPQHALAPLAPCDTGSS